MRSLRHVFQIAGAAALVLVLASGCGNSAAPMTPTPSTSATPGTSTSQADVTITIVGMNGNQSYSANPTTVKAGQTVAWRNADSVTHTATADGGTFNTGNIAPGAVSTPIVMSGAGTFAYHCVIHPSMVGTLQVQ
jgi:plastocyanin